MNELVVYHITYHILSHPTEILNQNCSDLIHIKVFHAKRFCI